MSVTDTPASATSGFKDGNTNGDDYGYDVHGNMTVDRNKGITTPIIYNHLNLPTKIIFPTGNITYIYNAAGQKVQKVVNETGQSAVATDYLGGYQYNNTVLQYFPTTEGYVMPTGSSYKYVFNYTDHLGNIRLSYANNPTTGNLEILEENNYFPFGLKHSGYNLYASTNYKYKYSGKELQDELGLNMYDMKARNYMPDIGRWGNMDELSEIFYVNSPYNFSNNNPVLYSDPTGLAPESPNYLASTVVNKKGEIIDYKDDGDNNIYLNKRGGEIVGKERAGVKYEVGNKIVQADLTNYNVLFSDGIANIKHLTKPVEPIILELPWYVGAPGSGWRTVNIKNFWLTLETFLKGGTMEVKIGLLLNGEEKAGNVIKLLKIMEADAKAAGATKLVLEGKAIMNTKLLNVQAWERLGYTVENVAETSIKVSKKL